LPRLRVLVIGYNAFDILFPSQGMPAPDSKNEVKAIHMGGGGPGATAAVAMAKLGAEVALITPLCGDIPGQIQEAELRTAGVDLSLAPRFPDALSPKAIIMVDEPKEERTIFWSRGALPDLDPADTDTNWLDGFDLLYTDGHEIPVALKFAQAARERNIPVVMDGGSVREGSAALVSICTDVISSGIFAPALTGFKDTSEALIALAALGPLRVGLTLGAGGVLAYTHGTVQLKKAFDVPVVDTTGAGDAFHAGYAFALGTGRDYGEALDFGNATAALKCRDWGGRRGLPDLVEVEQLLDSDRRK
jgi:sulfofructose kinase